MRGLQRESAGEHPIVQWGLAPKIASFFWWWWAVRAWRRGSKTTPLGVDFITGRDVEGGRESEVELEIQESNTGQRELSSV